MVRFLATCCLLLFSLLTASAQAVDLPQCSPDQFSKIEELSPEISALEDEMGRAETVSDVLRLNTEHLVLRQKLWDDIHLCDMNLEFISLFSARFNDVFVVSAMEGLSPGQEDSVRWRLLEGLGGETINLLLSNLGEYLLLGLLPGSKDSKAEPLAACSETQRQYARGAKLTGYIEILNQALAVETIEDLLLYDAAHLEFRESAWSDLPRCADAYEVASLMFRISGDFVVGHALAFLGVPRDSNPYVAQLMDDVASLPSWMIPATLRQPDAVYALFETSLPGCTAAELIQAAFFGHPLFAPDEALEENFVEGLNRDDLKTHARIEIDWRQYQFADSPRCKEALEITLALSEVGGDMVSTTGFSLAGEPELASLYRERALSGAQRAQALLADMAEAKEPKGEFVYEETHLPGCTADQMLRLDVTVLGAWQEMGSILQDMETRSDFARYAEAQFEWREGLLQRLPPCAEAVELSLSLHQAAGQLAGLFALGYANVSHENNAYIRATEELTEDIQSLLAQRQQILSTLE